MHARDIYGALHNSSHETCSVDLCNPQWRVAPYGWFCDEEEHTKLKRKKFKGADEGKRFHCVSKQELDRFITAKPPVNTE